MSQPVRLRGEEPLPIMVGALFPFSACTSYDAVVRAFQLHLCVKQVAEFVGNVFAVTNNGCCFVDRSEFRKAIRCIVVADGVDWDIHACNDAFCVGKLIAGIAVTKQR